jgi:hypothetical protein
MKDRTGNVAEAYPLCWPAGVPRSKYTSRAAFKTQHDKAVRFLKDEIGRLGGRDIIISTNLMLRKTDGMPYSQQSKIEDPGVAVYFTFKKEQRVFACDKWDLVMHNITAIAKTIEAVRGMDRWGVSDMLERVFQGFKQLPAASSSWFVVLGVAHTASKEEIQAAYRKLALEYHPDRNSNGAEQMAKINHAYDVAMEQFG